MKKLIQIVCSLFIAYSMTACVGAPVKSSSTDQATLDLMDDMNRAR